MNQACRELFVVTEAEVVGKYNILADNLIEAQGHMPLVRDVFNKGVIARFIIDYDVGEVEHIDMKGGTNRILDVVVSPIMDAHGNVTNAIVQHKDVTELKQAEEALRKSEEKFSILFNKSSLPIALSQYPDHKFADVNDAWLRLFGLTREEVIGKTSIELAIVRDAKARERIIGELHAHDAVQSIERTLYTKSGDALIVLTNISTVTIGGQQFALHAMQDITERKRAEEELQKHRDHLEERVKERTAELQKTINLMSGREVRMTELKETIKKLRVQLEEAGLTPAADDPLKKG